MKTSHIYIQANPAVRLRRADGKVGGLAAGNDNFPTVLPATANLHAPFAPTSDQAWLTIAGFLSGGLSFAFTANSGPARTAHITLVGQTIPIIQGLIGTSPNLTGVQPNFRTL